MSAHITTSITAAAIYFILNVYHNFYLIISDIYQYALISSSNILLGLNVTLSEINLSKLNIFYLYLFLLLNVNLLTFCLYGARSTKGGVKED